MKKQFTCNCGKVFLAKWTKGLCPHCRKRADYERNYKGANPYGHRIESKPPESDSRIKQIEKDTQHDIDWMEGRHLMYNIHMRHHHKFGRGVIRSHNEINRNFFTGKY